MPRSLLVLALSGLLLPLARPASAEAPDAITFGPTDWPWWRGPTRDGVAPPKQSPPLKWSETENVLWKAPVPGRGHGSPIVVGGQVFLTAAEPDREVQSVLCFDRRTGRQLWQKEVHRGSFGAKGNAKSSMASSTPACDGRRVFVNFLNKGAIHTTALDRDGKQLWQTKVADYVLHQGFGSSPALAGPLVIVSADNKGGGSIVGMERASGKVVWRHTRPKAPNYASPILLRIGGREQVVLTGCDHVTALAPLTGEVLWETKGSTTECVTSAVTDGRHVFTSGGYPKNHLSAVRADGSGKVVWEKNERVYVPSLLAYEGHLYGVQDAGVAVCWKGDTGEEVWRKRLGGTFSSSPVRVGARIYATNEAGRTFVYSASPRGCEVVAENQLGSEVLSTPAICGDRIYFRVSVKEKGARQEVLYCVGK